MMKRFLLLFLVLLLSGCVGKHKGSFVGDPLPEIGATEAIAADTAGYMASEYPPGHTSLVLENPKKNPANTFSQKLEADLRTHGFTLAETAGTETSKLGYILDAIRSGADELASWYVHLRITNSEETRSVSRVYNEHGQPLGGFACVVLERASLAITDRIKEVVDYE